MSEKVLVVYAAGCVGADGVAAVVAEVLASRGADVTLESAADCEGTDGYDLVVIGTDLWKGEIVPEALAFVRAHGDALASTRTACFAVSLALADNTDENRGRIAESLRAVTDLVKPTDTGLFAGALDPARAPLLHRLIRRLFGRDVRDHRDWDAIRFWAGGLVATACGDGDAL